MNERENVVQILVQMDEQEIYLNQAVSRHLAENEGQLSQVQKAFVRRVVYGVTEHRLYLDHLINHLATTPLIKMAPLIRGLLRSSFYQLLMMEGAPDYAIVDQTVAIAKQRTKPHLAGFVNGILRQLLREKDHLPNPQKIRDQYKRLSLQYSFPLPLLRRLAEFLDKGQLETFLQVSQQKKKVCLRVNRCLATDEQLKDELEEDGKVSLGHLLEGAFYVEDYGQVTGLKAFQQGKCQVQDESSMLVGLLTVERDRPMTVVDICAAPGGKATHLAELLPESTILAYDKSVAKVALIKQNTERLHLSNLQVAVGDATKRNQQLVNQAEALILDVPCSGLGVLRGKPDIKYHLTSAKIDELIDYQRQILITACDYVKKDGILMYSTCTINPSENSAQIEWFLQQRPDFEVEDISDSILFNSDKAQKMKRLGLLRLENKGVSLLPSSQGTDGFFIAKLRRVDYKGR